MSLLYLWQVDAPREATNRGWPDQTCSKPRHTYHGNDGLGVCSRLVMEHGISYHMSQDIWRLLLQNGHTIALCWLRPLQSIAIALAF